MPESDNYTGDLPFGIEQEVRKGKLKRPGFDPDFSTEIDNDVLNNPPSRNDISLE